MSWPIPRIYDYGVSGVQDMLTSWIPLMEIPVRIGGLAVQPGGHRRNAAGRRQKDSMISSHAGPFPGSASCLEWFDELMADKQQDRSRRVVLLDRDRSAV